MTRIKVCCISSLEEARTAIGMGAHADKTWYALWTGHYLKRAYR